MPMRIYLNEDRALDHEIFLNRTKSAKEGEEPQPDEWQYCYLNGLQLGWDGQLGMPFIEIRHFGSITPLPSSIQDLCPPDSRECFGDWKDSVIERTTITDSWVGEQPACRIMVLSKPVQTQHDIRNDPEVQFEAILTRRGDSVQLELSLLPGDPQVALLSYRTIRRWDPTELENLFGKEAIQLLDKVKQQ